MCLSPGLLLWALLLLVLPDVPTAREQGIDFEVTAWQGLFLPKDTPAGIVQHLNQALSAALDLPFVHERFKALGEDVAPPERRSPEYFAKFVAARDREVVRADQGERRVGRLKNGRAYLSCSNAPKT